MRSKGGKRQTKTSQQVRALSLCLPYASQVFSLRIDVFLPYCLVYRRQEASSRRKRDKRSARGSDGLNGDAKSFASSSLTAPPPRPLSHYLYHDPFNTPRYRSPMHIYPAAAREQPFIPIHSISRILLSLSPARRALLDEVFPTSPRSSPPLSGGGLLGGPTYRLSFLLSRTSSSLLPSSSSWTRRRTNGASLTYLRPQHQALRHRRSPATRSQQAGKRATRSEEQLTLNVRSGSRRRVPISRSRLRTRTEIHSHPHPTLHLSRPVSRCERASSSESASSPSSTPRSLHQSVWMPELLGEVDDDRRYCIVIECYDHTALVHDARSCSPLVPTTRTRLPPALDADLRATEHRLVLPPSGTSFWRTKLPATRTLDTRTPSTLSAAGTAGVPALATSPTLEQRRSPSPRIWSESFGLPSPPPIATADLWTPSKGAVPSFGAVQHQAVVDFRFGPLAIDSIDYPEPRGSFNGVVSPRAMTTNLPLTGSGGEKTSPTLPFRPSLSSPPPPPSPPRPPETSGSTDLYWGTIHLYREAGASESTRDEKRKARDEDDGRTVGLISVPGVLNAAALLSFIAPALEEVEQVRMLRCVAIPYRFGCDVGLSLPRFCRPDSLTSTRMQRFDSEPLTRPGPLSKRTQCVRIPANVQRKAVS